jgi:hypothetical protein
MAFFVYPIFFHNKYDMNVDKIFNLFDNNSSNVEVDFSTDNDFCIQMITKLFHREIYIKKNLHMLVGSKNEDIDLLINYFFYDLVWNWLVKIDTTKSISISSEVKKYLHDMLFYFEELEEYEKCMKINSLITIEKLD